MPRTSYCKLLLEPATMEVFAPSPHPEVFQIRLTEYGDFRHQMIRWPPGVFVAAPFLEPSWHKDRVFCSDHSRHLQTGMKGRLASARRPKRSKNTRKFGSNAAPPSALLRPVSARADIGLREQPVGLVGLLMPIATPPQARPPAIAPYLSGQAKLSS